MKYFTFTKAKTNKTLSKKTIIILTFTLFIFNAFAQQPALKKIDSMLINIDKATLTTNVLYNRVFPFAKLAVFNDSINVSNKNHFEQALSELYKSSNKQKFTSHKQLRTLYTPDNNKNIVDIGVINASFQQLNYIEDDQQKSALKITNNKFEKIVNDKPIFIPKEVLIISPLKEYLVGDAITYHFNNAFLIQNANKTISSIIANFDTPNDYTIYANGTFTNTNLTINYNDTGYKTLTFLVTYNDNTTQTTQAMAHVKRTPLNDPAVRWSSSDTTVANATEFEFQGYDEATAINGEIEYRIWYAGNNRGTGTDLSLLQKPIIIVDGFDPLDKRKIIDDDSNKPANKHYSIKELMIYFNPSTNMDEPIIEKLNLDGYDVIIVNQPSYTVGSRTIDGGADYIERNGLTHASFYQEINRNLTVNGSNEELVIMGPSMGGLISRYALAFMEKKEAETGLAIWNHNTRLWVSIDSPHLGANIPIGVQTFVNQAKDSNNTKAKDFVEKELGSPAARQILIEQFNSWNGSQLKNDYLNARTISQGFNEDRGHPFFIQFYNNLYNNGLPNSKGFPQDLKRIAMVNGSLTGSDSYKSENEIYHFSNDSQITTNVRIFQNFKYWFFGWHFWSLHVGSTETYNMPAYTNNSKISRFKKMFDDESKFVTNINSRGNMDNISGGYFGVYDKITDGLDGSDPLPWPEGTFMNWDNFFSSILAFVSDDQGHSEMSVRENEHVSSFIPTASSLALKNPNFNWSNSLNRNLVCTNETPFDSYYGETYNTQHVSFTQNSFNWLKGWLDADPTTGPFPEPTVYSSTTNNTLLIIGSNKLCLNEITTYTISSNLCSINPITWTVSNNLQIISSNNNEITVQSTLNSGNKWIRVSINGVTTTKKIIGKPSILKNITIGSRATEIELIGNWIDFDNQEITDIIWTKTGGNGTLLTFNNSNTAIGKSHDNEWYIIGNVQVTNSCDTVTINFILSSNLLIGEEGLCTDGDTSNDLFIQKSNPNEYVIINPCTYQIQNITNSELYNAYGVKEQDITPINGALNITNSQPGSIKIIKAVTQDGNTKIKRVVID